MVRPSKKTTTDFTVTQQIEEPVDITFCIGREDRNKTETEWSDVRRRVHSERIEPVWAVNKSKRF